MTLRLRTAVCLLAVLTICTPALPAWTADANTCAAGGGGGGASGGGGGGGGGSGGGGAGGAGGGSAGAGAGSGSSGSAAASAGGTAAATSAVGVGPGANSVAPAHNGGVGLGLGTVIRNLDNGGFGPNSGIGGDAGGDPSAATLQGTRPYSMRAIYFRHDQSRSTSDCLTAAYTQRLPLEVCQ